MGRINAPVPLTGLHQTIGFDCGTASLNEWLSQRALKNEHGGGSRTYVVCDKNRVIAYYALAAGSVARAEVTSRNKQYARPIPALVLGRLAVDCDWQGQSIGQGLLIIVDPIFETVC